MTENELRERERLELNHDLLFMSITQRNLQYHGPWVIALLVVALSLLGSTLTLQSVSLVCVSLALISAQPFPVSRLSCQLVPDYRCLSTKEQLNCDNGALSVCACQVVICLVELAWLCAGESLPPLATYPSAK